MVVNLASAEQTRPLQVAGNFISQPVEVWRLDQEHNAERLADQAISSGDVLTFPAQSVTLYVIPKLTEACATCAVNPHRAP